ncbi:hypothetical protein [Olleya sp. HaHaR_3_96]|uniref:hypothetical protein n=1 Tax=Olleya sp. HaHaR_3_96 TaxID=2745560 RepID=UPI001C4E6C7F|nr:hypothetical protein [Olleya sp. HaHaR_3_96]QXP61563.1 hypothetical protein H0I26_08015 [Olleya sp. HaHaR_3_96]
MLYYITLEIVLIKVLEIFFNDIDAVFDEHYKITDAEQQKSEYNQLIENLLSVFNRNKYTIFDCLKCTEDFKVLNGEHKY